MLATASQPAPTPPSGAQPVEPRRIRLPWLTITWADLFLILLETGCFIIVLIHQVAVPLGVITLAAASKIQAQASPIHENPVRLPLLLVATVGAIFNLYVVWNGQRLRRRPEAQWRIKPLRWWQKLKIGWVVVVSVLTLIMVAGELIAHPYVYPGAKPPAHGQLSKRDSHS